MDKVTAETIQISDRWVELSNQQDLEGLSNITDKVLEIVGPRGSGVINHQELGDWTKRANLKLRTIRQYAKEQYSLFEQEGTWLNEDDTVKGQAIVFTVFKVVDRKVTFLARYDNKEKAFEVSGLKEANQVTS